MNWTIGKMTIIALTLVSIVALSVSDASAQWWRWRRNRCCCQTYYNPCCTTAVYGGYGVAYAPAYTSAYTVAPVYRDCGCGINPGVTYRSTAPVYTHTTNGVQTWTAQPQPSNEHMQHQPSQQPPPPVDTVNQHQQETAPPNNPDQRNDVEPVPDNSGTQR